MLQYLQIMKTNIIVPVFYRFPQLKYMCLNTLLTAYSKGTVIAIHKTR